MSKHIKYPIIVTQTVINSAKFNNLICAPHLKLNQYIGVDVLEDGYQIPHTAMMYETKKEAKKACDVHNTYLGFNRMQVYRKISESMQKSLKQNKNEQEN